MRSSFRALRRGAQTLSILSALTAATAGATPVHPLNVTQTTGSGGSDAFLNTSASGSALQGEVASSANTTIAIPFGVLGEYNAAGSTFGMGVAGISTTGYGVAAEVFSAQPAMLSIGASTGDGLDAYADGTTSTINAVYGNGAGQAIGVYGTSSSGYGIIGYSTTGYSMLASTPGAGGVSFLGAPTGEGLQAFGYSGNATHPALTATEATAGSDLFGAYNHAELERFTIQAGTAGGSGEALSDGLDVQTSGDVYVYGRVFQDCTAFPATSANQCSEIGLKSTARTASNGKVAMYAAQQSQRTVEDFGTAQLVNGAAYVRLDPAFAQTMSSATPYLVFVTPGGDCRNLYVTHKTPGGFDVRETGGGRSTVSFDYRIVGKPFADTSVRLAAVAPKRAPASPMNPAAVRAMSSKSFLAKYAALAARRQPAIATQPAR